MSAGHDTAKHRLFHAVWRRWLPRLLTLGMTSYVAGTFLQWSGFPGGSVLLLLSLPLLLISVPWAVFRLYHYFRDRVLFRVRNRIIVFHLFAGLIPLLLILLISVITLYLFLINLSLFIYDNEMKNLAFRLNSLSAELMQTVYDQPESREDPDYLHYTFSAVIEKRAPDLPTPHILFYRLDENRHIVYLAVHSSLPPDEFLPEYLPDWLQQLPYSGVLLKHYSAFIYSHNPLQVNGQTYFMDIFIPFGDDLYQYFSKSASLLAYATLETQERDSQAGLRHGSFRPFNGFRGNGSLPAASDIPHNEKLFASLGAGGSFTISTVDTVTATDWYNQEHHSLPATGKTLAIHLRIPLKTVLEYLSSRSYAGQIFLKMLYFFIYFFLIVEVVSIIVGVFIIRAVTRSMHQLYRGTKELRKGNFSVEIPVRRRDELGVLSESFNAMARSVRGLLIEVADKQRIRRELEIARQVQQEFFPKKLPEVPGLALIGKCRPAREVSGDFYDFIPRTDGILDILVGDISGKGISAALLMASVQSASRAQPPLEGTACTPEGTTRQMSSFLQALNVHLFNITPEEKFATLFLARLCVRHGRLFYCNAGHESPFLIRADGTVERLETGGTVLGVFPEIDFEIGEISLRPGDLLAVYTDGLPDAVDKSGADFGEERLLTVIQENRGRPLEELHTTVTSTVVEWFAGVPQHDDITLVLLEVGASGKPALASDYVPASCPDLPVYPADNP